MSFPFARRFPTWPIAALACGVLALGPAVRLAHAAATTVREPAFGLPHIFADTDLELARENGRQIARDRLGQLILLARVGRGTIFQVFGLLDYGDPFPTNWTRELSFCQSVTVPFQVLPPSLGTMLVRMPLISLSAPRPLVSRLIS